MSKDKRRKRFQNSLRNLKRQMDIAKLCKIRVDSPYRFDKMHATNCGDSNCMICGNPRKFFGEKTLQERKYYGNPEAFCEIF